MIINRYSALKKNEEESIEKSRYSEFVMQLFYCVLIILVKYFKDVY